MAKGKKVEKIKDNISTAFDFQSKDNWKENSKRYLDYYKGKFYTNPTDTPDRDWETQY